MKEYTYIITKTGLGSRAKVMENKLAVLPRRLGSSGRQQFKKWKNNEESYINKTQQQMNMNYQQWRENYYKTIIEKCLPGGWRRLLCREMGSKRKVMWAYTEKNEYILYYTYSKV